MLYNIETIIEYITTAHAEFGISKDTHNTDCTFRGFVVVVVVVGIRTIDT